jgi:DNA-binding winged helix-turn-helix (wHTH) protein
VLHSGSERIEVEPQVFDLLVYLEENRHRVVSKDDLVASIWGDRIVSDSTLTSRINAARKAVGDSGEKQKLIRTIARKGRRNDGRRRDAAADTSDTFGIEQRALTQQQSRLSRGYSHSP